MKTREFYRYAWTSRMTYTITAAPIPAAATTFRARKMKKKLNNCDVMLIVLSFFFFLNVNMY